MSDGTKRTKDDDDIRLIYHTDTIHLQYMYKCMHLIKDRHKFWIVFIHLKTSECAKYLSKICGKCFRASGLLYSFYDIMYIVSFLL